MSRKLAKFQVEELEQRFEMGWLNAKHETTIKVELDGSASASHAIKW